MRNSSEHPGSTPHGQSEELTVMHIIGIVQRSKRIIFRFMVAMFGIAAIFCVVVTRQYQATGEIEIQRDAGDALGLDSLLGGGAAGGVSDALEANVTLQTQVKVMESQTLALSVIDQLHLANTPDFAPKFSIVGWATGWLTPKGPPDPPGAKLGESPVRRNRLFLTYEKNTKVALVAGTRLITVSYTSTDPRLAAKVVNEMIQSLIDYNFQTRYTATTQTSEWLGKQLTELRTSSDALQKQVADLQRSSEVFTFGGEDLAGKATVYSSILDQLQQTTVNLNQAQSNRILTGAIYEATKSGNSDVLAGLAGAGAASGSSPSVNTSLALLQGLRTQEAAQKALLSETAAKFGPAYPKLEEMKANLSSIQRSVEEERVRLNAQAKTDFEIATQVEAHTRTVFDERKKSAQLLNDKAIQYQLLRQEADQSRDLYSRLQSRLMEAGVLQGLRSSNITVVEPGRVPARPSSPNVLLLLIGGLVGGGFIGLAYVFTKEITDSTIRSSDTVANTFGTAYLGEIPVDVYKAKSSKDTPSQSPRGTIAALIRPYSSYCEALRSLRTALMLPGTERRPQVLLVTSPCPQDGKSTISINLAIQLAKQGRRVLLVDADLRRPTLHKILCETHPEGLSTYLDGSDQTTAVEVREITAAPGLFFLPAGPAVPYPAELLGSDRFREMVHLWREEFECIVIDSSPLLVVTDSVLLAPLADQILLVARYGATETSDLARGYRLLQMRVPEIPIGIVLNAVEQIKQSEYSVYGTTGDAIELPKRGFFFHG